MNLKGLFASCFLFVSFSTAANWCEPMPEVGKPIPNFEIKHGAKSITSSTFHGKWLILDFWFPGCISCINSFPKIDQLQKDFKDQVQFVLVGVNGVKYNGQGIETLYGKLQKKFNYQLLSVYDSMLAMKWEINAMPHMIIINPKGIVYAITSGIDMTKEKVRDLVDGKQVSFAPKDLDQQEFDPFSSSSVPAENLVCQSVISKWNGEASWIVPNIKTLLEVSKKSATIKLAQVPLSYLYELAYLGYIPSWISPGENDYAKYYVRPILEAKDTSVFNADFTQRKNNGTYNYALKLKLPFSSITDTLVMDYLKDDLKKGFGYSVFIEDRTMPVWELVSLVGRDSKKLRTKSTGTDSKFKILSGGTKNEIESSVAVVTYHTGFSAGNYSINKFLQAVTFYLPIINDIYIDGTGIDYNIDITIDAIMNNIEEVKKALKKNGLDLVKKDRLMKVLVIKDGKYIGRDKKYD